MAGAKGLGSNGDLRMAPENGNGFCVTCLKFGCNTCRALEGSDQCAFCEDGVMCPTRKRALAAGISAAAVAAASAKNKSKEKTMETRTCSVAGCDVELKANNKSGRCTKHYYVPKSQRQAPAAAPAETPAKPKKAKPAKKSNGLARNVELPSTRRSKGAGAAVATICVTESALDRWWAALAVEQKAESFNAWMQAGQ